MQDKLVLHTTDGVELTLSIAGIGSRSYAFLIDWHIRLLLAVAWLLAVTQILPLLPDKLVSGSLAMVYLLILPASVLYFLYHPIVEVAMRGRTPGKRMAGVRIVTIQGQTPSIGALLIRNVFRLVDSMPFFYVVGLTAAIVTARQVRLGDLAAGTVLVYDERPRKLSFEGHTAAHPRLERREVEWVQDLLERWPALNRESRCRLATKLLERLGETPAPWVEGDQEALRERLKSVVQETREEATV